MPDTKPRHERVPNILIDARLPGEDLQEYRDRRHRNQKAVRSYLKEPTNVLERTQPSTRVLRRLIQGKRTIGGLRGQEKAYINGILGVSDERLHLIVAVHNGTITQEEELFPEAPLI